MSVDEIVVGDAVVHGIEKEAVAIRTNGNYRAYGIEGLRNQPGTLEFYRISGSQGEQIRRFFRPNSILRDLENFVGREGKVVIRSDDQRSYSLCLVIGNSSFVLNEGRYKKTTP